MILKSLGIKKNLLSSDRSDLQQNQQRTSFFFVKYWNIFPKARNEKASLLSPFLRSNSAWVPSQCFKKKKGRKYMKIRKEEKKLHLFTENMIAHVKTPKGSTEKLLKLIYQFSTSTGNKGHIQKNLLYFYILAINK